MVRKQTRRKRGSELPSARSQATRRDIDLSYPEFCKELRVLWSCKIKEALPPDLAPRQRLPNGAPISHGRHHDKTRLAPSAWPSTFKRAIVTLAKATPGAMNEAHTQLRSEVASRQHAQTHPLHYAREVLRSDVLAVAQHFQIKRATESRDGETASASSSMGEEVGGDAEVDGVGTTTDGEEALTSTSSAVSFEGEQDAVEENEGQVTDVASEEPSEDGMSETNSTSAPAEIRRARDFRRKMRH